MSYIPNAKLSPRMENGMLKFYEGDTFPLTLELQLEDENGENITIAPTSTVTVIFRDAKEAEVKTFTFDNVVDNTVVLDFDSVCSVLFPKGEYHYRVLYTAGERTTLAADNMCVVE